MGAMGMARGTKPPSCGLKGVPSMVARAVAVGRWGRSHRRWERSAVERIGGGGVPRLCEARRRRVHRHSGESPGPVGSQGGSSADVLVSRMLSRYGIAVLLGLCLLAGGGRMQLPALECFLASWSLVAVVGGWAVPKMGRLKQTFQEDGPEHARKEGTPTAGGAFFVPIGVLVGLCFAWPLVARVQAQRTVALAVACCTFSCGLVGLADDLLIIAKRTNKGVSPRLKLSLQLVASFAFCAVALLSNYRQISLALPLLAGQAMGVLYSASSVVVIAGESNAVNLTDGIDGLASGLFAIAAVGLGATLASPRYSSPGLALMCWSMAGAACGFLAHNGNPAKIFMGDTGSLALGAFLASTAVGTGCVVPFLLLTMVFNLEMLSVMLQVGYYKWTRARCGEGRRIFKMAPFHHHLEQCNWSEGGIVLAFYASGICLLAGNFFLPL
ncbi:phospho-N-acetylmuramoyl-pentapeptide-transferase [Chloropicon primus]|uniref:Phospho-N-acetylmuramoyl-pentapeptide-transferase n=2 Tax=Chloropicon primus TaxID=1764295 RepID=A0A5B8MPJ8_9CHLO|nr:phospho-N-acetylmuramoyl-pentapeptide-transferase [Chloropicon primus]|eukprot:QDZ21974.1 phospho-N-acetylmuramoyl-pentapeptide-transferase [Chloropicon primus]